MRSSFKLSTQTKSLNRRNLFAVKDMRRCYRVGDIQACFSLTAVWAGEAARLARLWKTGRVKLIDFFPICPNQTLVSVVVPNYSRDRIT
jgi:hypothetical protein